MEKGGGEENKEKEEKGYGKEKGNLGQQREVCPTYQGSLHTLSTATHQGRSQEGGREETSRGKRTLRGSWLGVQSPALRQSFLWSAHIYVHDAGFVLSKSPRRMSLRTLLSHDTSHIRQVQSTSSPSTQLTH